MSNSITRRPRGFSLIEVIAVVMILGIVSAVVIPYVGEHDNQKIASAGRQLIADLSYAQSRAIATGRVHYVVFDMGRGKYDLCDSIEPLGVMIHPVEQTPYEVIFGAGPLEGVRAHEVSFDGQTILAFDATGTPCSCATSTARRAVMNAGSITLECGKETLTVTIAPFTGEISVH
jgi:prepilin-type N-terminal cleavage/methylation domain-containing protein